MFQPITLCFVVLFAAILAASPSCAGTVSGQITNVQHPATVTVKQRNGQLTFRVRTNAGGRYSIFLPVDDYTVEVNGKTCGILKSFDVPVRQNLKCR